MTKQPTETPTTENDGNGISDEVSPNSRREMLFKVAKWTPPVMMTLITPARAQDMGSPPPFNQ